MYRVGTLLHLVVHLQVWNYTDTPIQDYIDLGYSNLGFFCFLSLQIPVWVCSGLGLFQLGSILIPDGVSTSSSMGI